MGPRVDQVSGPKSTDTQVKVDVITAQKGDTLEKISKREGIPISDLKDANPKMDPKKTLNQGQDVHYPKELLVQHGETTLDKVADRLEMDKGELAKANPQIKNQNNLREGQHINVPKDFENVEKRGTPIKQKTITKDGVNLPGGAGQIKGGKGGVVYHPPSVKIWGVEVPLPDVVLTDGKGPGVNSTDGKYDGTGPANTERRREEDKNISNTRQKDERDIDPRDKKKSDGGEKLKMRKSVEPDQLDEELQKRIQQEAAEFIRRGAR
jgi:LysM repeat protein